MSIKALQEIPQEEVEEAEEELKPAPTAMEIALRKAMDDESENMDMDKGEVTTESHRNEAEEILARTLENRRS